MTQHTVNQDKMTTIPSKELRALRKENQQLLIDLDKGKRQNSMLLYLMGWNRDRVDTKDECIIILQEKMNQAIAMLENSADTADILRMLKGRVDFYEAHPTFVIGMRDVETSEMPQRSEEIANKSV